jgi:transposase-like protein
VVTHGYSWSASSASTSSVKQTMATKGTVAATRRFFTHALKHSTHPGEVTTDRAAAYPRVLDELVPAVCHVTEQYANNAIEADHGRDCCTEVGRRSGTLRPCAASAVFVRSSRHRRRSPASGFRGR